jgi:DNA-binding response OmpR family regulator
MQFFLLEDNVSEAAFLTSCLEQRGHQVRHFHDSQSLMGALRVSRPHGVILDWMVPEVDGFVTLQMVRELCGRSLPVVMLTGLASPDAIVRALDEGADDFLIKPMVRAVLVARIESQMRRRHTGEISNDVARSLRVASGPYRIDAGPRTVVLRDSAIALTPKEFDVTWLFFTNASRFIPKSELIASVWGKTAELSQHTLTQHVYILRTKLRLREHGYQISAVYGSGYRLSVPTESVDVNGRAWGTGAGSPDGAADWSI